MIPQRFQGRRDEEDPELKDAIEQSKRQALLEDDERLAKSLAQNDEIAQFDIRSPNLAEKPFYEHEKDEDEISKAVKYSQEEYQKELERREKQRTEEERRKQRMEEKIREQQRIEEEIREQKRIEEEIHEQQRIEKEICEQRRIDEEIRKLKRIEEEIRERQRMEEEKENLRRELEFQSQPKPPSPNLPLYSVGHHDIEEPNMEEDDYDEDLMRVLEEQIRTEEEKRKRELEREIRRLELEEQDEAYLTSVMIDKSKEEEKERQKREKLLIEKAKVEKEQSLRQLEATLPCEPSPSDPNAIHLTFQLPNGERVSRHFLRSHTLQIVKDFLYSQQLYGKHIPPSFHIVTDYPKKIWDNYSQTLSETKFQKRQLLRVEQSN
jgi:hypothetical protein